jgi:hypothetical protein
MTVRRLKTYTAATGYVYQYYFVGKQEAAQATSGRGMEYIFDVSSDRKTSFAVAIVLSTRILAAWATRHGRALGDPERYAVVKMRLFQGFDEIEDMRRDGLRLSVETESMDAALAALGIQ